MDQWWQEQVASGFAGFTGARVSGTVPISDRLLNDWLQQWLAAAASPRPSPASGAPPPSVDVAAVVKLVRRAEVKASDGVLTVDFEIGV